MIVTFIKFLYMSMYKFCKQSLMATYDYEWNKPFLNLIAASLVLR